MKYVRFEFAGKVNLQEIPFLTSRNRRKRAGETIFHRNDFHTVLLIPVDVFRACFEYARHTGVYRTSWTCGGLAILGAKIETLEL